MWKPMTLAAPVARRSRPVCDRRPRRSRPSRSSPSFLVALVASLGGIGSGAVIAVSEAHEVDTMALVIGGTGAVFALVSLFLVADSRRQLRLEAEEEAARHEAAAIAAATAALIGRVGRAGITGEALDEAQGTLARARVLEALFLRRGHTGDAERLEATSTELEQLLREVDGPWPGSRARKP